jgi:hypothetical protein
VSSEQAQAKDNGTVYGYGRPAVLTGAAPAGVAIAQNAGPGKSQCQHPGSGKSQREHRLGPRPGCRRVAFSAKVGVVYTAADIEELFSEVDCNDGSRGRAPAAPIRQRVGPTPGTVAMG